MFYQNTTKMPYILRNSSNTGELTVALYFKWTKGETIFTLTALPRRDNPCETIQLYHYRGLFYVNFQSKPYYSKVVIIDFFNNYCENHCFVLCCVMSFYLLHTKKERKNSFMYSSLFWMDLLLQSLSRLYITSKAVVQRCFGKKVLFWLKLHGVRGFL